MSSCACSGFPGSSAGKESSCNVGDPSSIPRLGRSPGEWLRYPLQDSWAPLVAQTVKNPPACNAGFDPWVGKIPWRRKWQPTPVFLPGESHGRRSLMGYSPRVAKSQTHWVRHSTVWSQENASSHCTFCLPRKWFRRHVKWTCRWNWDLSISACYKKGRANCP